MKIRILLIFLALVATLSAAPTDTQPSYRFTVEKGAITVTDVKTGAVLGTTTIERLGRPAATQDQLRHVALDVTAAVVAGAGHRENTMDPSLPVYTAEEQKVGKAPHISLAHEGAFLFLINSDSKRSGRYEA